jgi:hypothetical protein
MPNQKIPSANINGFSNQLRPSEAVLFWEYIDGNPATKEVLAGLQHAGCDPLTIVTLAALYCEGEHLDIAQMAKRATGYSAPQLGSLSERLLQAAKDIQALNDSALSGGVTLWKLIRILGGGETLEKSLTPVLPAGQLDFEFTRLPVVLAAYAVFLKGWPHPTYRALMSDTAFGRSFFLVELATYVEVLLGHANWNSVSAVIRAVHAALGQPQGVSTDAEQLRAAVEEFQRRNREVYSDIRRWAESAVRANARQINGAAGGA